MEEILDYLEKTGRHKQLLSRWHERNDEDIRFEVLFAYWCDSRELYLKYEVGVNPNNDKTVDFNFTTQTGVNVNLELVRPDLNKGIRDKLTGDVLQGYILTSDHKDPDFRTCAQHIKLQWALLEKVVKFPECSEKAVNIVIADCSNVHAGMFDRHDAGMAMYGYPGNPIWQEYWENKKLIGIWEQGYNQRGSKKFCENVSAVVFVPELKIDVLQNAMITLNPLQSRDHQQLVIDELKFYSSFVDIAVVNT